MAILFLAKCNMPQSFSLAYEWCVPELPAGIAMVAAIDTGGAAAACGIPAGTRAFFALTPIQRGQSGQNQGSVFHLHDPSIALREIRTGDLKGGS